ncbi:MAG: hypothetical protein LBI10_02260 [Deltaproteobacteria bacterium]|jgi:DNA polymerase III delta' subunit|nr:hypothetical protein [Deltaproteobacteria bacterium]
MPFSLIGLGHLENTLSRILKSGRFPHALLLTGPRQGGKFTLAKDLAKALNCANPGPAADPCGVCLSCRKIEEGHHPDFLVLRPKGVSQIIAVDDVRQLTYDLSYRPFEGKRRVAVIQRADLFENVGGNALLKTLEEPGPSAVLILTAVSESRVMPTLVSRCVRLRVPPLSRARVLEALKAKLDLAGPRAELLAGLANGALGAALALDPESTWEGFVTLDLLLGQALEPTLKSYRAVGEWASGAVAEIERLKKLEEGESKKVEPDLSALGQRRAYYETIVSFLRLWWRDVLVLAITGAATRRLGPPPTPAMRKWAARLATESGTEAYLQAIDLIEEALNRSLRSDLVFANYWLSLLTTNRLKA